MKPIKLTMQAFGTFAEETIIDFSSLNDKVFLIYGKTGSGKTTIFDAICYALYGEVTGDLRNEGINVNVRSTKADDKTYTYVEYEFELNSDRYIVRRTPGKQRIYKKINEFKSEQASIKKNGVLIELKTAACVTNYISTDVLKLTRDQFKQTMMISQGEFAALIKATSDERSKIFRNILNTYNIDKCTQDLKNKVKELYSICNEARINLNAAISYLPSSLFDQEYYQKVTNDNSYTICNEIVDIASKKLDEFKLQKDELINQKDKLNNQINESNNKLGKAEINNSNITDYQRAKKEKENLDTQKAYFENLNKKVELSNNSKEVNDKYEVYINNKSTYDKNNSLINNTQIQLQQLEQQKESIETNFNQIPTLKAQIEYLTKTITTKESTLSIFKELDSAKAKLDIKEREKNNALKEKENAEKSYNQLKKMHEEAQTYVNEHNNITSLVNECNTNITNINDKIKKCNSFIKEYHQILTNENNIQTEEKELQKLDIKQSEAQQKYYQARTIFLKNQAGILAQDLEDNKPCPVCGSTTHPNKCSLSNSIYTEDELNELEKVMNISKDTYNKKESSITSLKDVLSNNKNNLVNLINNEINLTTSFEECNTSLNSFINQLNTDLHELNQKKVVLDQEAKIYQEKQRIVNQSNELSKAESTFNFLTENYNNKVSEYTAAKTTYNNYLAQLNDIDKDSLNSQIASLNNQKSIIENTINLYQVEKSNYDKQLATTRSSLNTYKDNAILFLDNQNKAYEKYNELQDKYHIDINTIKDNIFDDITYNQYKRDIDTYKENVSKNAGYLEQAIKNGYDKLNIISTEEIKNNINTLNEQIKDIQIQIDEYNQIESTTIKAIHTIKSNKQIYDEKSKDYIPYKELSDTFAGEISGKQKISFETFYQVQFFKQILILASRRFSLMTDGQYEIVYKDEVKGAAKSGLDMEVLDVYNSTTRNIGTLSGGESFMASLSLALSMSDIIQAQAGGISLDSMFIDEGFGTLDADSLNNAITEISKLSVNGKTVGLISHVEELKNRIPTQLCVEKKESGSIIIFNV